MHHFLGTIAKLRERLLASPCLSVLPQGTAWLPPDGFSWNVIITYLKSIEKIQVSLKYDKNNGYLSEDICNPLTIISRWILLRIINVSNKSCTGNQNTLYKFNKVFWRLCLLCDNVERYCRTRQATDDNLTRRMRSACWTNQRYLLFFYGVNG
jgi:hypothetical protein